MTPCGCQAACGCNVTAGNGTTVQRLGDTFLVTAVADPTSPAAVTVGPGGISVACCDAPEFFFGDTPPEDPDVGDVWFDTST